GRALPEAFPAPRRPQAGMARPGFDAKQINARRSPEPGRCPQPTFECMFLYCNAPKRVRHALRNLAVPGGVSLQREAADQAQCLGGHIHTAAFRHASMPNTWAEFAGFLRG